MVCFNACLLALSQKNVFKRIQQFQTAPQTIALRSSTCRGCRVTLLLFSQRSPGRFNWIMVLVSHQRGSRKTTVDELWGRPPPVFALLAASWMSNYSLSPPTQATKIELISHYVKHCTCWAGPVRVTRQQADMSNPGAWHWVWAVRTVLLMWSRHFQKQSRRAVVTPLWPRRVAQLVRKEGRGGRGPSPHSHTLQGLLTWNSESFKMVFALKQCQKSFSR